jgi:hypothetical protein
LARATFCLGNTALFQATTDNEPQTAGIYVFEQDTAATSVNPVLVTISPTPAAGSGIVRIKYAVPSA